MKLTHLMQIAVIGLALTACGNKKTTTAATDTTEETTPERSTSSTNESIPFVETIDAYAESAEIGTNEQTNIIVVGGSGNLNFSLSSGPGSVDHNGTYTASSSTGFATIVITDLDSGDSLSVTIEVLSASATQGCTQLGSTTVVSNELGIEKKVDMENYSELDGYVIVGVGLRVYNQDLAAIFTRVSRLKSDGSIEKSNSYHYGAGDLGGTSKGELYIQLPDNYYLYGVGFSAESTGQDVDVIKVYGARLDGSTGEVTNTIECYLDRDGNRACYSSGVTLSSSHAVGYNEYVGGSSRPLVGFGFGVIGSDVTSVWAKDISLSYDSNGNCSN